MTAILKWMTADPARAFAAGAVTSPFALVAWTAWLPASLVVLALLVSGPRLALAAAAGTTLLVLLSGMQAFGPVIAIGILVVVLLPAWLAGHTLAQTRNLSLVYQWMTLIAVLLVLAIHAVVGNPVTTLMPVMSAVEPMLQQVSGWLTARGIEISATELGTNIVRTAWRNFVWTALATALLALFSGLWAYGRLREPGVFGREFRRLRLGAFVAWALVASFLLAVLLHGKQGQAALIADDVVSVLAAAFLVQALSVVHGLREMQIIGLLPMIFAYAAILIVPQALVGIGFADTWFRFRERFAKR